MIGISLICVMMVSLGLAFDPEKDQRYLPFLIAMAFVTLMFFLVKSSQSNLKRQHKTLIFYFASLAEMLAFHSGLYGRSLCRMVPDKPRRHLSAPAAGGGPVEHGMLPGRPGAARRAI